MIASEKKISLYGNDAELLDTSFSSYLNGSRAEFEESLKLKLNPTRVNAFAVKTKVQDDEIGIFGAEKYFKGAIDEELPRTPSTHKAAHCHAKKVEGKDEDESTKPKNKSATPSVQSESSWNSRTGLVVRGNNRRSHREKNGTVKSLLATLGCNCNDKGSVHVQEAAKQVPKTADLARKTKNFPSRCGGKGVTWKDCYTFPAVKTSMEAPKIELAKEVDGEKEDEITQISTRNSLEVFGSPILEKGKKSFSLERKLTMLNWDGVTPRGENIDISKNGDTGSDASSDLFELESFSTNGNLGRSSNATLTNGYAPSEASIQWSVVTASVAEFSVASDYEDTRMSKAHTAVSRNVIGSGILSGCTSHKSVRVSGEHLLVGGGGKAAFMVGTPMKERCRLESARPISIFQAEKKVMGTGLSTLPRAHSPRASHRLYIQQQ